MDTNRIPKQALQYRPKDEGTLDDRRRDGGTNFILRIKEQETRLTLHNMMKMMMMINHEVLANFQQNLFQHEISWFILRSNNLLILFGIRKNCSSCVRCQSLHLSIRKTRLQYQCYASIYTHK